VTGSSPTTRKLAIAIAHVLALAIAMPSCSSAPPPGLASLAPAVTIHGSFREQMQAGRCDEGVALRPLLAKPHLYAIGPLAGLRGELLVWDGTVFTSRIVDGTPRVRIEPDASAAFLVASHVRRWRDVAVPDDVVTLPDLERWLPQAAAGLGLAPDRPHTVRLFAGVRSAKLHVLDLPAGAALDPAAHVAAAHAVALGAAPVQLLGFLSPPGQATCPIASPPLHLHLRTLLGDRVGHVEELTLSLGAKVEFAIR
jgi:acetolactate decarboxylase